MSDRKQNTDEKFHSLRVWQQAHQLTLLVYKATRTLPDSEKFGLISQMRRASVSVVANIVEGSKRLSIKDRLNFHTIANGSLEELKYYFILCEDLGFISKVEAVQMREIARDVGAMLWGLTKSIRSV